MTPILGAVIAGLLYSFSFPPFSFHFFAWFWFVPLFLMGKPRFSYGFLTGFVANLIIFFWLWKTFHAANVSALVTLSVWLALAGLLALYFGVFVYAVGRLPHNLGLPLVAGLLWVVLEQIRSVAITGFPWALLAHTQSRNLPILQWASFFGEPGISFLLIAFNIALALFLKYRTRSKRLVLAFLSIGIGLLYQFGAQAITIKQSVSLDQAKLRVAVLQGNINQYQKWDSAYESQVRAQYEALVQEAIKSKPDLIVWPESAVPGWFPNDATYFKWVSDVVVKSHTNHLIGAVTSRDGQEFNSAFLINSSGTVVGEYSKQHLVPFGEYIPFGGFLKRWIPYLGQLGTFSAGSNPAIFEVKGAKIAPNICYEAIFAPLVQKSVVRGADVIINITNDGWFLDSAAPAQHFDANIFRAVESGRPVIRAANTGISAAIDSSGTTYFKSKLMTTGVFVAEISIPKKSTFFSMLYSRICPAN